MPRGVPRVEGVRSGPTVGSCWFRAVVDVAVAVVDVVEVFGFWNALLLFLERSGDDLGDDLGAKPEAPLASAAIINVVLGLMVSTIV